MHPAGVLFFVGRDVSAGDGVHTYSCVRYTTLPSVCTDYARSVSQADETGFYAPSVAHNAFPSRPWLRISVLHGHNPTVSKQLRYALSRESVCTTPGGAYGPYAVVVIHLRASLVILLGVNSNFKNICGNFKSAIA